MRIKIKVIPKSGRQVVRLEGETLKVWLKSTPEDGKANVELVRVLADLLKISRSDISIAQGSTSRNKTVEISGISGEELGEKLKTAAE